MRAKFILVKVLEEKVRSYRAQAYARGYQEMLFGPSAAVETSFDFSFRFDPLCTRPGGSTNPAYKFQEHYYPLPGELDNEGEEFDCAFAIDRLPQVKYWLRNLELQPDYSFWLPTSSDRFYPDFVALLNDGRLLVVEYKGEAYVTNDDSREKKLLGQLWEDRSKGAALFLMAEKRDKDGRDVYRQLEQKVCAT